MPSAPSDAGPRGLFPFSIAVHDCAGGVDDRDFRNEEVGEIKLHILNHGTPAEFSDQASGVFLF
jgi:hypothetical protein